MNPQKAAAAYRLIGQGYIALSEAIEQPQSGVPRAATVTPVAGAATPAPADTFSSGSPLEEPPSGIEEGQFTELVENIGGTEIPVSDAQRVLAECPVHFRPWVVKEGGISPKTGKPYKAFWKCNGKNDDGSFCDKRPEKDWVKTHDPEKALLRGAA